MTAAAAARLAPIVILLATMALVIIAIAVGSRKVGFAKRPILVAGLVLGALPLLYVEATWARLVPDVFLRVSHPAMAVAGAVACAFVSLRLRSLSPRQHPFRRATTEALLVASALGASLAGMGLELGSPIDRLTLILLVDRSRSIDLVPNADARLRAELAVVERGMREEDRIGTVAFAAEAMTEDPPHPKSELRAAQHAEIGRDATDLAAGIRRALAEAPPDSAARIVVLSDGVATRGDAVQAAAGAVAAGVPIDVVPLDQRKIPDVRLVAVRMPARADEKEPIELRIVTSSDAPADVEIRVSRDGIPLRRATGHVEAGEDVLRLKEIAPGAGLHRYDVAISSVDPKLDEAPEDNAGAAFVRVRGEATALVLEGEEGKGAFVAGGLRDAAFRVDVATGTGVPGDVAGFAGYDVVVFSDIRASDLVPSQIEALASYVRDLGGGLVLLGGDRSMGPGGYAKTALEDVSPVSFDLKQERRRASLAEVISIDYSGSMGAHVGPYTKLDLANEAAARSAELLGGADRLGVAHVDTVNRWTVPLGPVTDTAAIGRAIKATGVGGGGIYVDVALDEGYAALSKETVNLKHMLLFADGNDAERLPGCRAKVAAAFAAGITTSVVALGKGHDVAELEVLSKLGGGRFYLIEDATRLPSVFAQETILASKSAIHEVDFVPSLGAPGAAVREIDFHRAPVLKGYVVTIPKPRASVHLVGPDGDPILATWSVGVGRAAAFTSDLKDRWGVSWTSWPEASRMVGQLARDIARKSDDPHVRLESDTSNGELHVRATVLDDDGRAQSFRRLQIHVGGPDGFSRSLPLEVVGAGAYAATIPLGRPGTYVATASDELSHELVGSTGAMLTMGEELRPTGTDRVLLARLAAMTGGRVRDTLAGAFLDRPPPRFAYRSIAPELALAAAVALLLSVAARKLAFPSPGRAREHAREPRPLADVVRRPPPIATVTPTSETTRRDASSSANAPLEAQMPPPRPSAPRQERKLTAAEILLAKRRGRGGPPGLPCRCGRDHGLYARASVCERERVRRVRGRGLLRLDRAPRRRRLAARRARPGRVRRRLR